MAFQLSLLSQRRLKQKTMTHFNQTGFTTSLSAITDGHPFVNGFRHLPKLLKKYIIKSFWKSRNLFTKRVLVVEDKLGGGFWPTIPIDSGMKIL